jgi:uncharacterized protein YecE (DUF72 family)
MRKRRQYSAAGGIVAAGPKTIAAVGRSAGGMPPPPSLFDDAPLDASVDAHEPSAVPAPAAGAVEPAAVDAAMAELAAALQARWGDRLHLGTSSWHFPGWAGQVWARALPESVLSRQGLAAYARHPLLRTVSLDRAFYRPLDAATYARLAAQASAARADFRFVVKAPALLTDAMQREPGRGTPLAPNPAFLDVTTALEACARPLAAGLGPMLGALVLQISPLPPRWLRDPAASGGFHERLAGVLAALRSELPDPALIAVELRDPDLLTPALAALLREHRARYALGLHDRMPAADEQLPLLRALWPGDLVCRWNLQRGQRYAEARDAWAPFDRLRAPDPATRATLARVARATLDAGHRVFITINNKAEGSAPASVRALAEALLADAR